MSHPRTSARTRPRPRTAWRALAWAGALVLLAGWALAPAPAEPLRSSEAVKKDMLDQFSLYLARQRLVSGRFVQTNPNGEILAGRFFLARPGRVRFAYTVPRDMLIVSDGEEVHIRLNRTLPVESYPLELSPLALFLHYDMDFYASHAVVGMEQSQGQIAVRLRDPEQVLPGELVMQFAWPQVELLGWIVRDSDGKEIAIRLQELRQELTLDSRLFTMTP